MSGSSSSPAATEIRSSGFTVLFSNRKEPILDIVIIHGLQGNPVKTWTAPDVEQKRYVDGKKEYYKADIYWPQDFLAQDFPKARVMVYGYDSKVSKFFKGAADKKSFLDHARDLLNDLVAIRREAEDRPLLFICHSLGGILVKEVLRRAEPGRQTHDFAGHEKIFTSTCGIIFMGTPHRGGNYASISKAAERIVRFVGFDTNSSIIRELREDSQVLALVQEEFMRILEKQAPLLTIYSFQESTGLAGVQGLDGKVVDDGSSVLNYRYEIVSSLPGNHMEMCRFNSPYGGYWRLSDAVKTYMKKIQGPKPREIGETPLLLLPFARDEHFVGRVSEIEWLDGTFSASDEEFVEAAIVGLGGIGKTQIANEFAHQLSDKAEATEAASRPSVFWIHASTQARLEHSFKHVAQAAKLMANEDLGKDVFPIVRDWLQSDRTGRWILIIDNADDERVFFDPFTSSDSLPHTGKTRRFCDFLPRKQGCAILYTSRHRICAQRLLNRTRSSRILNVGTMPKADSTTMLLNELYGQTNEEARSITPPIEDLLELLEHLPLAITQAASFMRENSIAPEEYTLLFKDMESQHAAFLAEDFVDWRRDSDMPNALLLTWKLSFEQIKSTDALAVHLLSVLSVLDRHGVAPWMLSDYFAAGKRWEVVKALRLLESFSFYHMDYGTHRLLQLATRAWLGPEGWDAAVQDALRFLCNVFGGLNAREWADWDELSDQTLQRIMDYYPHTKSVLAALAEMQSNERTLATLDGFFAEWKWNRDGLVSETFAEEANGVYQNIAGGDYGSLVDMIRFVKSLREGTRRFYISYDGPFKPRDKWDRFR